MFGRATIRLGIGPYSSYTYNDRVRQLTRRKLAFALQSGQFSSFTYLGSVHTIPVSRGHVTRPVNMSFWTTVFTGSRVHGPCF